MTEDTKEAEEVIEDIEPNDEYIWHKQEVESGANYTYFSLFLQMGSKRNLVEMKRRYDNDVPGIVQLRKLSAKFNWRKRATAYDEFRADERRKQFEEDLDEVMHQEFGELREAYSTASMLRKRIENDTSSSTYSLLNAFKNYVEGHNKITQEMHMIVGKPTDVHETRVKSKQDIDIQSVQITDEAKINKVKDSLIIIDEAKRQEEKAKMLEEAKKESVLHTGENGTEEEDTD